MFWIDVQTAGGKIRISFYLISSILTQYFLYISAKFNLLSWSVPPTLLQFYILWTQEYYSYSMSSTTQW